MPQTIYGEISWERMTRAVEKIRQGLRKATAALKSARIPYAVIGGNAVAAWVSRVDEAAVRNTRDVDLLLRRADFQAATTALAPAGFVHRHVRGVDMFLDGPQASARDAIHVIFANEKVSPDYALAAPDVTESESSGDMQLINLSALVRMKLTSFPDEDRVHLRDLLEVGSSTQAGASNSRPHWPRACELSLTPRRASRPPRFPVQENRLG